MNVTYFTIGAGGALAHTGACAAPGENRKKTFSGTSFAPYIVLWVWMYAITTSLILSEWTKMED